MKRLLVTGASGLLGSNVVRLAERNFAVVPIHNAKPLQPNSLRLDITKPVRVLELFRELKPDAIIHAASETNVDRCEREKEQAWSTNVEGTHNIALACRKANAKCVYISTDYVFDGKKGNYKEQDKPNPVNYYGLTKLEGENQVIQHCQDFVILRTSVLFGWHPWKQNFVTWTISQLTQSKESAVVKDHFNTPTNASSLAEMAVESVQKDLHGLYHASGSERISRFEFARRIAEIFCLPSHLLIPVDMSQLTAWKAVRPKDSSLSIEKIQKQLKTKPLNVAEGLRRMKEERKL
jgi:dTDP-4-dehydrorhamnose reductase